MTRASRKRINELQTRGLKSRNSPDDWDKFSVMPQRGVGALSKILAANNRILTLGAKHKPALGTDDVRLVSACVSHLIRVYQRKSAASFSRLVASDLHQSALI
jgi:hypothetical protein